MTLADSPHLEQPEVFLLLQTVLNILLPPRIISTSRSKNFMLESSPAHCSTPGDTGKDLRREGLAESTSQAAYLGTAAWGAGPVRAGPGGRSWGVLGRVEALGCGSSDV